MMKLNAPENIIGSVDYTLVKSALNTNDLNRLINVYDYFIRFDTQVSSELHKRKLRVVSLPIIIQSEDKTQDEFLKSLNLQDYLFDLSSAIAYGFAVFSLEWINSNGIKPKLTFLNPRLFYKDKNGIYAKKDMEKIYIKKRKDIFIYYHKSDSGDLIQSSLMYKIVCILALKQLVLSHNMSFFENLSVPPFIIKSEKAKSEEDSKAIIDAALNLRSGGVALFDKDDILELLDASGASSKADFLDFTRYCDECISKIVTGQVLAGNAVKNGTQALGTIHNEIRKDISEYDAKNLSGGIKEIVAETLALNFAKPAPFIFEIDTNTEEEEAIQAEVYLKLTQMGYKIPVEHMQKIFKIEGLSATSGELNHRLVLQPNTATTQKHLDKFDKAINEANLSKAQIELQNALETILQKSATYEEAFEKLSEIYADEPLDMLEDLLFNAITNAELKGLSDV